MPALLAQLTEGDIPDFFRPIVEKGLELLTRAQLRRLLIEIVRVFEKKVFPGIRVNQDRLGLGQCEHLP